MSSMSIETTTHKNVELSSNRNLDDSNKKHRGSNNRVIAWLESLRVPKALALRLHRENVDIINADGLAVVSGLDRVFFGTQPACEALLLCGFHPPRYLCYMVSGFLCDVIQFGIDLILHTVFLLENASVCWALGFAISVSFRHTSHRYLVFGDYVGGFWQSLGRMYAGYSIIIVLSTLFNVVMTTHLQLPHYAAWLVTLLWTGIVNYFILKKLWSFGGKEKKDDESSSGGTTNNGGAGGLETAEIQKDTEMQQDKQRTDRRLQARKTDKR